MAQTDLQVQFGEWLKLQRKRLDLTQEELAQVSGCSVYSIRKIEAGGRRPSKQLAELLARALEIPPQDQGPFVRVARGEWSLERLVSPLPALPAFHVPERKPTISLPRLPFIPTPFIGRERELQELKKLLWKPDCRLLTITGMGGIGKTRLAIEVVASVQGNFPDGVVFVELAALSSPEFILPAIAEGVRLKPAGPDDLQKQLLNALKDKRLLLLMDNAEHLLDGVGQFSEILASIPSLKMLVTSRERLDLQMEWCFDLHGLPVTSESQSEQDEQYSSVALFLQRARQVKVDFYLGPDERQWVVKICQLVEGLPLGIELAAAWVSMLSCKEIAQEIEARLDFLATLKRDIPMRHRSLRGTFNYSWNLLTEEEQTAFSRISAFRGGFTRQAAEQVSGASLPLLSTFLSKSLIVRKSDTHFDLHPLIRQFAYEKLQQNPDLYAETVERHRAYFLDFLATIHPEVRGPNMQQALEQIQVDLENVREAWQRTVKEHKFTGIRQAEKCLIDFFELRARMPEAFEMIAKSTSALQEELDQRPDDIELRTLLGLLYIDQSFMSSTFRGLSEVLELALQGCKFLTGGNDPSALGYSLLWLGLIHYSRGDLLLMEKYIIEGQEIFQKCGDERGIATALGSQARLAIVQRRFEEGIQAARKAERIYRAHRDDHSLCLVLIILGDLDYYTGRYKRSKRNYEEALALSKSAGFPVHTGNALVMLSQLARDRNELEEAKHLIEESASYLYGREALNAYRLFRQNGNLQAALGEYQQAQIDLRKALEILVRLERIAQALDTLLDYARLLILQGQAEQALGILLYLIREPGTWPLTRASAEQLRTMLTTGLSLQQVQSIEILARNQSFTSLISEILPLSEPG